MKNTRYIRLLEARHFALGDLIFLVLTILQGNQQNFRRGDPTLESGKIVLSISFGVKLSLFWLV